MEASSELILLVIKAIFQTYARITQNRVPACIVTCIGR